MIKRFKNDKYNSLPHIEQVFKAEVVNEDVTKLTIYGDIGSSYFYDSISASDVEKELKNITSKTIEVHLSTYGGDVFDGISIYNQLKNHQSEIIIHVDGIAASAGSLIALSGDKIIMNTGSMMMIHEGSTFAFGSKTDIKKTLNALEGIDKSIADIYMTRFTGERSEIDEMIVNETWLTSSEALEIGFADKVEEDKNSNEIENLKAMVFNLQSEITKMNKEPIVVPVAAKVKSNFASLFTKLN
jgi:ATP-dependent Clp protease protease subunit